jgi:hypothetical protein
MCIVSFIVLQSVFLITLFTFGGTLQCSVYYLVCNYYLQSILHIVVSLRILFAGRVKAGLAIE